MSKAIDAEILTWAAYHGGIPLTYDVNTVPLAALQRVANGLSRRSVFEIGVDAALVRVIGDILILDEASCGGEWDGQVHYVPFS